MALFDFLKRNEASERPCPNSDSGEHIWQDWTDTTQTYAWRTCEAGCGAQEDLN